MGDDASMATPLVAITVALTERLAGFIENGANRKVQATATVHYIFRI
jgi:hypothetical protein